MLKDNISYKKSKLDSIYSLSSKISCADFAKKFPNYKEDIYKINGQLLENIDLHTFKPLDDQIKYRKECPLCSSKKFRFIFQKHGFDHMICDNCEIIFTHQVLIPSKSNHLKKSEQGDEYGSYKDQKLVSKLDEKKFNIVFDQLKKVSKIKNILDIGSNIGKFLEWASCNYKVTGHEYHDNLRKIAISRGYNIKSKELSKIKFKEKFDLITCWDYLDHILNPKETFKNLSKQVKKGGLLFFAINNRDSLSVKILHKDSPIFIGPHHSIHYGARHVKFLLEPYGWKLVSADSYVSELNWISNWLNFKNPEFGDSSLQTDLFNPEAICNKGLGFKVNLIFIKK